MHRKSIAIVGTRKPTEDGIFLTNYIGACVSYFNTATVSGLAHGIDQIIHRQSIRFKVLLEGVLLPIACSLSYYKHRLIFVRYAL